jgi:hypothetical protein
MASATGEVLLVLLVLNSIEGLRPLFFKDFIMCKFLVFLLVSSVSFAQSTTYTTNYQYAKPDDGSTSWGDNIRGNWDKADAQFKTLNDAVSSWTKYTVTYAQFSTAAATNQVVLANLPAGTVFEAIVVNSTAAFTGGSISAYTIDVDASPVSLISSYDAFLAPTTTASGQGIYGVANFQSPTSLIATANSSGGNLDTATAGSVDIYVKFQTLP